MIAVIADDLTGAAELAGISLRYGLTVKLCLHKVMDDPADVLIMCTDSRSMNLQNAININEVIAEALVKMNPAMIYKKIDSVMRGYVLQETKILAHKMDVRKVIIAPANPSLNRTIQNGTYFIGEQKITETGFASDPEFPAQSNFASEILGDKNIPVLEVNDTISGEGIFIAAVSNATDVATWAHKIEDDCLAVGGGDFFSALLGKQHKTVMQEAPVLQQPFLYVCGTAYEERRQFVKTLSAKKDLVSWLPEVLTSEWINNTVEKLNGRHKLVLAIDKAWDTAATMRKAMAAAVKNILVKSTTKEIFIEGGSTAAAILAELKITDLQPQQEISGGVVRMQAGNYFITMKPGSYPLPAQVASMLRE